MLCDVLISTAERASASPLMTQAHWAGISAQMMLPPSAPAKHNPLHTHSRTARQTHHAVYAIDTVIMHPLTRGLHASR
jgi:hypothetical protein